MRLWTTMGIGLIGLLFLDAPQIFGLEAAALHVPPSSYRPLGACAPGLGTPYQGGQQQGEGPVLFYHGGELIKILVLLKEEDIKAGHTLTVLNEFGGIPITDMGFAFSQQNPITRQRGSYYEMWLTVDRGRRGALLPC